MSNRRRDPRVSLPLEAQFEGLSVNGIARLSDLGVGGCFVETLARVSVGEEVNLKIHSPTGRWLPLQGEVVYQQPNLGFGLRFINQSELEREMLEQIIEYGS
jgi:Tfp pilus assembly protein PilZ